MNCPSCNKPIGITYFKFYFSRKNKCPHCNSILEPKAGFHTYIVVIITTFYLSILYDKSTILTLIWIMYSFFIAYLTQDYIVVDKKENAKNQTNTKIQKKN